MRTVIMISANLLLLGLIVFLTWYVPRRLLRLLGRTSRWTPILASVLLVAAWMAPFASFIRADNRALDLIIILAGLVMGLHLYAILLMLTLWIVRRLVRLPDRTTALAILAGALLLTFVGAWQAGGFKVTETEIPLAGLEREVVLMHISDVHLGRQRGGEYMGRIVAETNQRKPDLVLINGDLVDAEAALRPGVLDSLAEIRAPVYFTTGNHESSNLDTARALKKIAGLGVKVLHNRVVQTHGLQLVGLDYMNADEDTFDMHAVNKLTLKEELPKIPLERDKPVILMHHSPVGLEYVVKAGVDLMLSGHTHAGQIFPGTLLTPLVFPLNKGLYQRGGTTFFVSQGAGTYGPRLRLGSGNEINLIRLKPAG